MVTRIPSRMYICMLVCELRVLAARSEIIAILLAHFTNVLTFIYICISVQVFRYVLVDKTFEELFLYWLNHSLNQKFELLVV